MEIGLGLKFGLGLKSKGLGLELITTGLTGLRFCCTGLVAWGLGGLNSSTSLLSTNIGSKAPIKIEIWNFIC